jgi:YD repeat-containing protein
MTRLMKKLSSNPRFKKAKKSGRGYVIPGAAAALVMFATAASAQQTTFRNANGRITTTVTTDSNGQQTFRDGSGRMTGTATTDSNGTTTFRDGAGRITGTASTPRR